MHWVCDLSLTECRIEAPKRKRKRLNRIIHYLLRLRLPLKFCGNIMLGHEAQVDGDELLDQIVKHL